MEAIILAGGRGTRLRRILPDLPKPMAPVRGRPVLEHLLDHWIGQGVRRFVLAVGDRHRTITDHFGRTYRGCEIEYSIEAEGHLLGTGGGARQAASLLATKPFLLMNGDTFFKVPLREFLDFHQQRCAAVTLAVARVESNFRFGSVEMDQNGRILRLTDPDGREGFVNGGVYLLASKEMLHADSKSFSFEKESLPGLIAADQVFGFHGSSSFLDIGTPEDYALADQFLEGDR